MNPNGTAGALTPPSDPTAGRPTLSAAEAASFVGCRSAAQFRREVKQGVWPPPIAPSSRPQRWSIMQLQAALAPQSTEARQPKALTELEIKLGIR